MYYEHFGLREVPFKFLPSETLFLGTPHREVLAALEGALHEPSGLTLLVGEVGSGKTMLMHSLVARLKDDRVRIAQLSNPTVSFEEMLSVALQQLGIYPVGRGKLASLKALMTFMTDPASTDSVILIVDEAQGLSNEILEDLRLLSDSRPPQRDALQIILVGQPELVQRLNDPKLRALNQRIGARILLRPLRGVEIYQYVNYLLRAHGARNELFSGSALDQVACLSAGLPRKINNLCHNSLVHAFLERSSVVEPRHVRAASVELENLLDTSSDQDNQVRRGAWHWMLGNGKPAMAGCLSALAAVAVTLAFASFESRRSDAPLRNPTVTHTGRAESAGEFSKPMPANLGQAHDAPQGEGPTAASLPPIQPFNHATAPLKQAGVVAGGPPTQAVSASALGPVAPKVSPQTMVGTLIAGRTSLREMATTLTSASSDAPRSAVTAPRHDKLTYEQERRLRYDIRRAKNSFQARRYNNAVYHIKRALLLDPDNIEMRDLLQRMQPAQSKPMSPSVHDDPVVSPDKGPDH
jgi:general secretion pathway protein A